MGIIGSPGVGKRPHKVRIELPGKEVADGEGGFTFQPTFADPPDLYVEIAPATTRELEQLGGASLIAMTSHLITAPFHPQVTTTARLLFLDLQGAEHIFEVAGVLRHDYRDATVTIAAHEVLT